MKIPLFSNIVTISEARATLGRLADDITGEKIVVLTKSGKPRAALVDIDYLEKLQNEVRKIYKKTYIEPQLIKYTREFSDEEIEKWLKEDQL